MFIVNHRLVNYKNKKAKINEGCLDPDSGHASARHRLLLANQDFIEEHRFIK